MDKIAVFLLIVLAAACGDNRRSVADDAAVRFDASRTDMSRSDTDDGVPPLDAGDPSCDDPIPSLADVEPGVLPRCAESTITCIQGCSDTDDTCFDTCIANDPMAPYVEDDFELNCDVCIGYQELACFDRACPTQFRAYNCCYENNGCDGDCPACASELSAIQTCLMSADCSNELLACFP